MSAGRMARELRQSNAQAALILAVMGIQPVIVRINHLPRQEGVNEIEPDILIFSP